MNAYELLEAMYAHKGIYRFEGDTGIKNLNKLCKIIGYNEQPYMYGSPLELFLSDNAGAIEAIRDFIADNMIDEWQERIEAELPYDAFDY